MALGLAAKILARGVEVLARNPATRYALLLANQEFLPATQSTKIS